MSDIDTLADGLDLSDEQKNLLKENIRTLQSSKLLGTDEDIAYAKKGSLLTTNGKNVLAKALAGATLEFTRIALGDSVNANNRVVTPSEATMLGYTSLRHQKLSLPVSTANIKYNGNGTVTIKAQTTNADIAEGFYVREVGLFAIDPDTEREILYSYKNFGVLSTYLPGYDGATAEVITVNLITVVDNASTITATINTDTISVSQSEFTEHVNSTAPHPNVPNPAKEITSSPYYWAVGTDNNLHPISKANMQTQLLGSNIYELPHLDSRISQTEINISNLFAELSALQSNGLEANLLFAENFETAQFCDLTKIKVVHNFGSDLGVCVNSLEGILEGHYYTLSDGLQSQTLRVSRVGTNDGDLKVFFDEPLTKTFDTKKTYLYRSTGVIVDSSLGGAGELRETIAKINSTYSGVAALSTATLSSAFDLDHKDGYTLSGDCAFTADGRFTLAS